MKKVFPTFHLGGGSLTASILEDKQCKNLEDLNFSYLIFHLLPTVFDTVSLPSTTHLCHNLSIQLFSEKIFSVFGQGEQEKLPSYT